MSLKTTDELARATPDVEGYDFTVCKLCQSPGAKRTFSLGHVEVFVCSVCGFHYNDVLAPTPSGEESPAFSPSALGAETERIKNQLEANPERLDNHLRWVEEYVDITVSRILDVGCGGGRFVGSVASLGAEVTGIELNAVSAQITRERFGVDVEEIPIEDPSWDARANSFNAVTFWDVIEHVNFPIETLIAARRLLADGGFVLLDTPRRDASYYRMGELTYGLSGGRYPTFLRSLYGKTPFGHKQIFSDADMIRSVEMAGLELVQLHSFKELSYPIPHYVNKLIASESGRAVVTPIAQLAGILTRVKNKMLVVARKPVGS